MKAKLNVNCGRFVAVSRPLTRRVAGCAQLAFATSALLALTGCADTLSYLAHPGASSNNDRSALTQRQNGPVVTAEPQEFHPEVSGGAAPNSTVGGTAPAVGGKEAVNLNFADTDVREVAQQILGQFLKVNYAIDPAVHGTVTYKSAQPVPTRLLLPTLETLLAQNGAVLVRAGDVYRVMPATNAASSPTIGGEATSGVEVVVLKYTSAVELARTLTPILGQGGARIVADQSRNAVVISGDSTARATIEKLVQAFDIDLLASQSYALFPITSLTDPHKVADDLKQLLRTEGEAGLAGIVRVIPMEEANAVLVVAPQRRYIEEAEHFFQLVDSATRQESRTWHVYYVQNGQAGELANILRQAFLGASPNSSGDTGSSSGSASPSTAPGLQTAQIGSGGATGGAGGLSGSPSGTTGTTGSTGLGSSSGSQGSAGGLGSTGLSSSGSTLGSAHPATESLSDQGGSGDNGTANLDTLRIISAKTNNAILTYATPNEENSIEAMLRKIDLMPLQVRIDATIAEVTLTDQLEYGTQFFFNQGGVNGLLGTAATALTPTGTSNFVVGKVTSQAGVVLSALAQVTNVRVLSSPQIMVLDNEAARLLVGDLVPYLSQTSQSTIAAGSPVVDSVDYRETGVILDVTPRVGNGGLVTLEVQQEVSAVQPAISVGGVQSPTFSDRLVHSRVVIQDGETVGLAGLISDNDSRSNGGIPFLKDVPVLGSLFSKQDNQRNRTELLVLITPHVIDDQRRARALTDDLRANLPQSSLVPDQLRAQPTSGSPDPNASLLAH